MKLIITLLFFTILLSGCAEPSPVPQPTQKEGCSALKAEYDVLQFNYDSLKRASIDSKELQKKYNALVQEIRVLSVEKAALDGQMQVLTSQYNAAIKALSGSQVGTLKALEDMNNQLVAEQERNRTINEQVRKVREKKVTLLSDNLTDIEYNAFYKGWNLWWGTFNEKDEEKNGE